MPIPLIPLLSLGPLLWGLISESVNKKMPRCPECGSDETVYVEPGIAECRLCLRSFNVRNEPHLRYDDLPTTAQTLQAWRADTNARCKAAEVDTFTRRYAALFLGVQATHYDRWEKGTAIPNPDQVARISAITRIPPEMLTVPNTLPSVRVVAARWDEASRSATGLSVPDLYFVWCFEVAHDLPKGSINPLIYTSEDGYTFYFIGGEWVDNKDPDLVTMTFKGDRRGPTDLLKD